MSGPESHVTVTIAGPVATIVLDRQERLNAFTSLMMTGLVDAMDRIDEDDAIRAVILTGRGRAFCAGADVSSSTHPNEASPMMEGVARDAGGVVALRFAASRKPIIAAVNGPAVGVGASMILPADIRIASVDARFGFVYARRGIVPESAASWFLPRVVGIAQASEWVLTGRVFDATEALAGRLVSRIVPARDLVGVATQIALEIAETTSATAVAAARQLLWSQLSEPSPWRAHMAETLVIRELKEGGDPAEGGAAFLEKRPPNFRMSPSKDYPPSAPHWPELPADIISWVRARA